MVRALTYDHGHGAIVDVRRAVARALADDHLAVEGRADARHEAIVTGADDGGPCPADEREDVLADPRARRSRG